MCGIAGIVERETGTGPSQATLLQMLAMIRHRGPDQFGLYLDANAGLVNARLSILDLDHGQQPIANENENLWIVFNGEIFNYLELRTELEARGHHFTTRTDTEVVLHAYEEFGPECLNQFNGQFAIAIWDRHRKELFLARDRLGVRPLFYNQEGETFRFGSEVKAILADSRVSAEMDLVALDQVFTYWSPLSPRTAFRGIHQLPPAHYLLVRDGRVTIKRYWSITFPEGTRSNGHRSLEDYVQEFRELLTDAVRVRLRADVPVGAYLSGGLDSSTVAALVRRLGISHLDTFSIAFSDPEFDERSHQENMARFLGTRHQVVVATHADIGRVFPEVIWHTEMPITRTAPAPMFLLSKLVQSHHYKVVLTGEGADEFLAGYDIFKEAMIRRFWARCPGSQRRPLLLRRVYPDIPSLSAGPPAYLSAFFGRGLEEHNRPCFSHAIRWQNNRRNCRFFSDELSRALRREQEENDNLPVLPAAFEHWHPLAKAQYLEIEVFLSQYLLSSQGDRPAMAHSVEGRFPFLDVRLVEFCNRLPPRYKLNGMTEKFLLREAVRDWLPREICQRPKRPYRAPIHRSFFNDTTQDYVMDLLSPGSLKTNGLFRPNAVGQLVTRIRNGSALGETDDMALVGMLSAQLVHRQFISRFQRARPLCARDDLKIVDRRVQVLAE